MKIVLLMDSLHSITAGSERQIYKLVEGLSSVGHDIELILLRHTAFSRTLKSFPCPIISLDIESIVSFDAHQKMLSLRKNIIARGVDVIHAYFPDSCLLAPIYLKSHKIKIITSRRDMGLIYEGKPAWLYKLLRHRTDKVISNSAAVAQLTISKEALRDNQSLTIYNGIETFIPDNNITCDEIYKSPTSLKLILVANVKRVKRNIDAVKAVHQLLKGGIDVELALIGELREQDYVEGVKQYIAEHNLSSHIHMCGPMSEPRIVLNQAHIGMLVSDSEGLSNTIMEYMYAGLPIIATNVGGNPELVFHEQNGLLVEKGNIPEIAAAIKKLSSNENYRKALGENGKQRIEVDFSINNMIKKHIDAYLSIQ